MFHHVIEELEVLDHQSFDDPWGLGYRMDILRADHPDWREFKQQHHLGDDTELMQEARRLVLRKYQKRKGFRAEKMPSEEILERKILHQFSELRKTRGKDAQFRHGVATILLRKIHNGEREATDEERVEMLREEPRNHMPLLVESWPARLGEYRGELTENGTIPYGGRPFSNAIRDFVLDMADSLKVERDEEIEDAEKNSATRPVGASAIGPPSPPATGQPS